MIAIWALVAAILFLAAVIIGVAWTYWTRSPLDTLSDEEIARCLAPLAAELVVWQASQDAEGEPEVESEP